MIEDTGGDAPVTADGWPATDQTVTTVLYNGAQGHYPKGRYTCLYYEGEGAIECPGDAVAVISRSAGKIVFDAGTDQEITLRLTPTNAGNPVRNLRVIMPGYEADYLSQPVPSGLPQQFEEIQGAAFHVLAENRAGRHALRDRNPRWW
jgi:hypothetical protein